MSLVQLYVPTEVSRDVIHHLGELNLVQFRDLNKNVTDFQRAFVQELRKLDNIERQYTYLKTELDKKGIEAKVYPYEHETVVPQSEIDDYAETATLLESRVLELTDSSENLYNKQKDLKQFKYTVQAVENFFSPNTAPSHNATEGDALLSELEAGGVPEFQAEYISGVIDRTKVYTLQQILWRTLRGNLYYYTEEIPDPVFDAKLNTYVPKNAFIIFSHGSMIYQRIKKIAESLDASLYKADATADLRKEQLASLNSNLSDLNAVLAQTDDALNSELVVIARDLSKWWEVIAREKAVYQTMNLCDYDNSRKTLIAEGWVPTDEIEDLSAAIKDLSSADSVPTIVNVLETTKTPPTFHRTNKFTAAFQSICDTYGVASYREINPGLPTIITFPFMFAIMFGDLGHGFIMFLAAVVMVANEKTIGAMKRDEIFDMAYSGRYILLLMGAFSMYTGFLYNDLFSKSMDFFPSGWEWPENYKPGETIHAVQTGVYAMGLDPAWHGSENALLFSNSYKMKLSVLMGYLHMTYSYFFSLFNAIFFHSPIDIIGNFIPGLLFMQGIFGYLSLCIVYKWTVNWFAIQKQPPGLLNMLITMFLSPGTVAEPLYDGQANVQVFLLLVALVCVPWLVLVKPLYLKRQMDKEAKQHEYTSLSGEDTDESSPTEEHREGEDEDEESHDDHNFGDIMIHQIIHTIEFCLNCVSHTASYLRLWALSLAHAQLSTVLWTMTLANAFGTTGVVGVIMTVFLFAMWLVLTVVILVIMEGTSAMLHSLRLHWVESMSKFFEGEGTAYEPFGFQNLLVDIF